MEWGREEVPSDESRRRSKTRMGALAWEQEPPKTHSVYRSFFDRCVGSSILASLSEAGGNGRYGHLNTRNLLILSVALAAIMALAAMVGYAKRYISMETKTRSYYSPSPYENKANLVYCVRSGFG